MAGIDRLQSQSFSVPAKPFPIDSYTWFSTGSLALILEGNIPFYETDWPNPQPPRPRSITLWDFRHGPSPDYLMPPFHQDDWPLPLRYRHPIGGKTLLTIFQTIPVLASKIRRTEVTAPNVGRRQQMNSAERIAPPVGRRVDD